MIWFVRTWFIRLIWRNRSFSFLLLIVINLMFFYETSTKFISQKSADLKVHHRFRFLLPFSSTTVRLYLFFLFNNLRSVSTEKIFRTSWRHTSFSGFNLFDIFLIRRTKARGETTRKILAYIWRIWYIRVGSSEFKTCLGM